MLRAFDWTPRTLAVSTHAEAVLVSRPVMRVSAAVDLPRAIVSVTVSLIAVSEANPAPNATIFFAWEARFRPRREPALSSCPSDRAARAFARSVSRESPSIE